MKEKIIKAVPVEKFVNEPFDTFTQEEHNKGYTYTEIKYGYAITYEYLEDSKKTPIEPGIYTGIETHYTYKLIPKNPLLEPNIEGINEIDLSTKIKIFLQKSHFFTERGLIPKRGALLHGYPGSGKTHAINKTVNELIGENGLAIYLDMSSVSLGGFAGYLESNIIINSNIDKLFLIIEDLGGGEITDEKKGFVIPSPSDLLSVLDGNALPWKTLPTVILSTTNYPKNFLENILDRPGRFDEVIEFKLPSGDMALRYAESLNIPLADFDKRELLKGGISLAHIKEAIVKSAIYDEPIHLSIAAMRERSEKVKKELSKKVDIFN